MASPPSPDPTTNPPANSNVNPPPRPAPTEEQATNAQAEFDQLVVGAEEAYRQYILSHASPKLHDAILPLVDAVHPVRVPVAPEPGAG